MTSGVRGFDFMMGRYHPYVDAGRIAERPEEVLHRRGPLSVPVGVWH